MKIYLDHASTTQVKEEVLEAMLPFFTMQYENPSSLHDGGIQNKKIINQCKKTIANLLNCDKKEVCFTSGGSEANNWALKGLAFKHPNKKEIITSKIEHHAISHTCTFLESLGYKIHYLKVNHEGTIDLQELETLINDQTLVVSIMMANNEIGVIQPMKQISEICRRHDVYLHTDAVQAICHLPLDLKELDVDLLSFSAHKFHGPKGIGGLYIKQGVEIENLIHGGQQEYGKRAGTENVPYIVGMTKAMELGIKNLKTYQDKLMIQSKFMINQIKQAIQDVRLNGPDLANRLPGNLNLSFKDVDGSILTYLLNKSGIYVSTGSACNSETIEPSHVLQAIGVPKDYIDGTIRLSLGEETTDEAIREACNTLIQIIIEKQAIKS